MLKRFGGLVLLVLVLLPVPASAIPVFARRYRVSCMLCHNPVPTLTAFGEQFAGNGFRMSPREPARDTIDTGDPDLWLPDDLPLSVRLDAYAQAYSGGRSVTDFQSPYTMKLLGSGAISQKLSWYVYALLLERGEFGGVEDAYVQVNDIGGQPVDVMVGQFQVSDPLFKRELRLMFEDYAVYRTRVGEEPMNLTYDRGVMAVADVAGFTLSGMITNGNGIGPAQTNRQFDDGAGKLVAFRASREIVPALRLGGFALTSRHSSSGVRNTTTVLGADATLSQGPVDVNIQYLHREDDDPFFNGGSAGVVRSEGGFVEVMVRPASSRWHLFGLYNLVTADLPVLDVRLGGPAGVDRYESVTAGVGYLARRNFKVTAEATRDVEQKLTRWTAGFLTAF